MKNRSIEIFIASVFLFFFIIYFLDFFSMNEYIIVRNPIQYKESFVTLEPAEANASYSLLNEVLPLNDVQTYGKLNSQTCYDSSFTTRLERTGNYLQRTNNYRRKDPESCTSPNQEFVNAYYKVEPLA
jgi:hypothetical protein